MGESSTTSSAADDLRLAQLACAKLAGMLQGVLSVGLPGLVGAGPDPQVFFKSQFEFLLGYARVLHTVGANGTDEVTRLRKQSLAVLTSLGDLQRALEECAAAPPAPELRRARTAATAVCDAVRAYGETVHLDTPLLASFKEIILHVFDGVEAMLASRPASANAPGAV